MSKEHLKLKCGNCEGKGYLKHMYQNILECEVCRGSKYLDHASDKYDAALKDNKLAQKKRRRYADEKETDFK